MHQICVFSIGNITNHLVMVRNAQHQSRLMSRFMQFNQLLFHHISFGTLVNTIEGFVKALASRKAHPATKQGADISFMFKGTMKQITMVTPVVTGWFREMGRTCQQKRHFWDLPIIDALHFTCLGEFRMIVVILRLANLLKLSRRNMAEHKSHFRESCTE